MTTKRMKERLQELEKNGADVYYQSILAELLTLRKLSTEMRHGICYAPFSEYAELAARFDALRKEW